MNRPSMYRPLPEDPAPGTDPANPPPNGGNPPASTGFQPITSQDALNALVAERVNREKAKFADYSDVKAKAKRLDDIEAANATELEKAVKAARDEGRTEATSTTHGILRKAEARALASASKFRDAADAVAFLDLAAVKVSDDGTVDADAIKAQLADLAKAKPYLLTDDTPPVPTPGQAGIGVTGGTSAPASPRAADLAQIERDIKAGARR